MNRTLRTALLALAGCGAMALTACGGSGGSTPAALPGAITNAPGSGSTGTTSTSTTTSTVTLSVNVPQPSTKPATVETRNGKTLSSRRVQYISPSSYTLTVTDNTNGSSGYGTCSYPCTSISASFQAPVGASTITAYLKDDATPQPNVLSQTINHPITVTAGQANTLHVTFDGVLYYFATTAFPTISLGTPSSGTVTLAPYDRDNNPITTSGNIVDSNNNILISADGTTQTISAASAPGFTAPTFTWNPTTYQLNGTVSYDGTVENSQNLPISTSVSGSTFTGNYGIYAYINPILYINPAGGAYQFTFDQNYTTQVPVYDLEIGSSTPAATVALSVNDALGASAMVSVDSDGCSQYFLSPPGLTDFTWPGTGTEATLSISTLASIAGTCQFVLSDEAGNTATVYLAINNPSITIQGRTRK